MSIISPVISFLLLYLDVFAFASPMFPAYGAGLIISSVILYFLLKRKKAKKQEKS